MKKLWIVILGVCTSLSAWALDVNKATLTELRGIKGIGPATAQAIVDARTAAPISSWDDLMKRVKGVGSITAKKWADQGLTVGKSKSPAGTKAAKK